MDRRSSVLLNGNCLDFSALRCSSAKRVTTRHAMYTCSLARTAKLRNVYCTRYWIPRTMPQYHTKQLTLCGFEEMSFAYIGLSTCLSSMSPVSWVFETRCLFATFGISYPRNCTACVT